MSLLCPVQMRTKIRAKMESLFMRRWFNSISIIFISNYSNQLRTKQTIKLLLFDLLYHKNKVHKCIQIKNGIKLSLNHFEMTNSVFQTDISFILMQFIKNREIQITFPAKIILIWTTPTIFNLIFSGIQHQWKEQATSSSFSVLCFQENLPRCCVRCAGTNTQERSAWLWTISTTIDTPFRTLPPHTISKHFKI